MALDVGGARMLALSVKVEKVTPGHGATGDLQKVARPVKAKLVTDVWIEISERRLTINVG